MIFSLYKSVIQVWFYIQSIGLNVISTIGVSNLVYPGAVHSRFEHSLGVYWLASEAINRLKAYQVISMSCLYIVYLGIRYLLMLCL